MLFENWLSFRYMVAKKGGFLSFLNVISIIGITIGVASLIVVTAVMTGFGNNLREKIIGTTPHILIEKETGIRGFESVRDELKGIEGITAMAPYVQGNLFLEHASRSIGLVVRGVEPELEREVTKVREYVQEGEFSDLKGDKIFIGKELAQYYGFSLGDKVTLISPGSGVSGQAWRYTLNIAGIFQTGMADYDMNLVLVPIAKARTMFGIEPDMSSGIGVKLENIHLAKDIQKQIYEKIGFSFLVKTWIDINRNLFEALFLEKWGLFIVLTLMVIIASFNIISTLIVTVTSKTHDIGILKSLGATKAMIRRIFINQGLLIGSIGTLLGFCFGIGLCYVLRTYVKVPAEIYTIDRVPVQIVPLDVIIIVCSAMMITYLATLYPAVRAAAMEPVEALRYE